MNDAFVLYCVCIEMRVGLLRSGDGANASVAGDSRMVERMVRIIMMYLILFYAQCSWLMIDACSFFLNMPSLVFLLVQICNLFAADLQAA